MEKAFPSPAELTVAEALLLLASLTSPSISPRVEVELFDAKKKKKKIESDFVDEYSLPPSDSKICCSSVTSSDGSTGETRADLLRVLATAIATRFHVFNLKIVKRTRSKRSYKKRNHSGVWRNQAISKSETTEVSSLSSERSTVSGARSQSLMPVTRSSLLSASLMSTYGSGKERLKRKKVSTPCIMRRTEAILKLLSAGCASEIRIRQVLGDSPDTSKALRMLLRMEEVKRSGAGGYRDPYVYMVSKSRSEVDSV